MTKTYTFTNIAPVFMVDDVKKTVRFYIDMLGFRYAEHFDKIDNFATVSRDSVEIIIIQKQNGTVESNRLRYGKGIDAYIDADTIEAVDIIYHEYKSAGIEIARDPHMTDYGSYEFVIRDIDGRNIGIGVIKEKDIFFRESNYII